MTIAEWIAGFDARVTSELREARDEYARAIAEAAIMAVPADGLAAVKEARETYQTAIDNERRWAEHCAANGWTRGGQ